MSTPTTQQRAPLHLPFVTVAILAGLGLLIVGALLILAPSRADAFGTFFLAAMAVVTSFAGLVYQVGRNQQTLEEIRTNTNGRLTAEQTRSAVLESQLREAGHVPATVGAAPPSAS